MTKYNLTGGEILGVSFLVLIFVLAVMALWFFVGGFMLMLLWNLLAVPAFGAPTASYWQGVAAAFFIWLGRLLLK